MTNEYIVVVNVIVADPKSLIHVQEVIGRVITGLTLDEHAQSINMSVGKIPEDTEQFEGSEYPEGS